MTEYFIANRITLSYSITIAILIKSSFLYFSSLLSSVRSTGMAFIFCLSMKTFTLDGLDKNIQVIFTKTMDSLTKLDDTSDSNPVLSVKDNVLI